MLPGMGKGIGLATNFRKLSNTLWMDRSKCSCRRISCTARNAKQFPKPGVFALLVHSSINARLGSRLPVFVDHGEAIVPSRSQRRCFGVKSALWKRWTNESRFQVHDSANDLPDLDYNRWLYRRSAVVTEEKRATEKK